MHSSFDNKGNLNVACCECERGGNGSATDKCASGWKVKKWNFLGCYMGELMPRYSEEARKARGAAGLQPTTAAICH
jgi:hypothetical protein